MWPETLAYVLYHYFFIINILKKYFARKRLNVILKFEPATLSMYESNIATFYIYNDIKWKSDLPVER